ncbi:MAG: hypothetical protein NTV84_02265 [Methanoregula sp.]|nr:hypothetical protein [Methanoregula sp.]
MLWKEQPIKEGDVIDYIQSLKQDQDSIELVRRSVRRRGILEILETRKLKFEDPQKTNIIKNIVLKTEGYVGADLEALCREAGMLALREGASTVTQQHFDEAIKKVHPTMNDNLRTYYDKIQQHFKGGLPKQIQPPEYQ